MDIPLLMNVHSGRLNATPSVDELRQTVRDLGYSFDVIGTVSRSHLDAEVQRLIQAGTPRIAIAGGDGTVELAVQRLAGSSCALGILPQGTMNNFATALRLPQDLPNALRVILEGEPIAVDIGRCGGRYFVESAGVGLFANALSVYGHRNKNLTRGFYALLRLLLDFKARRLKLTIDGEQTVERCLMCVAANTYRIAQGFPIAPGAQLTDGLLDVVILGDLSRREILPCIQAIRRQTHYALPKVRHVQAKSVLIDAFRTLPVHVDDQATQQTPANIEVVPHGLNVLVGDL
jgi:diacylglycerol kinase (ATP)